MSLFGSLFGKKKEAAPNLIRETLFGDMSLDRWPPDGDASDELPWGAFVSARQHLAAGPNFDAIYFAESEYVHGHCGDNEQMYALEEALYHIIVNYALAHAIMSPLLNGAIDLSNFFESISVVLTMLSRPIQLSCARISGHQTRNNAMNHSRGTG